MGFKVVLVGDSLAGKTALLRSLTAGNFTKDYVPTVFDYFNTTISTHDGSTTDLTFWDTSGSSEIDHIRPLAFSDAAAIAICFDISRPRSLKSVMRKWIHEVRDVQPTLPLMLIGCKADIRERADVANNNMPPCVSLDEGEDVARRISAKIYYEATAPNLNVAMFKEALALLLCDRKFDGIHAECFAKVNPVENKIRLEDNQTKRDNKCSNCCVLL